MLALACAPGAHAESSPTARLVYVRGAGAEQCPDEEALKQAVSARLGYDPFRPFVSNTLFAEVHREGGRFTGSVKMVDERGLERGSRHLEESSSDCEEIMTALALSMSIAIDPRSAFRPPASDAAGNEAPASPPTVEAPPPREEPAPPLPSFGAPSGSQSALPSNTANEASASAEHPRLGAGIGFHGTIGIGPKAAAGAHAAAEVMWPAASLGLDVRAELPTRTAVEGSTGSARFFFVGAELLPCVRRGWASLCATFLMGRLQIATIEVPSESSQGFTFAAAGLRAAGDVALGEGLALRLSVEAAATLTPFVLDVDQRRLYESDAFSGRAGVTLMKFF